MLKDYSGRVLYNFSLQIGCQDSNSAEIMAILKACQLCSSCELIGDRKVTIVSDSKSAVAWSNKSDGFGCLKNVAIIYEIRELLSQNQNFEVLFNPRSSNSFADSLAKMGSNGGENSVVWS